MINFESHITNIINEPTHQTNSTNLHLALHPQRTTKTNHTHNPTLRQHKSRLLLHKHICRKSPTITISYRRHWQWTTGTSLQQMHTMRK